ncbi:MAG: hypothetical protein ACTSU5_20525, partial [Promethearchaeota archaeon]
LGLNMYLKYLQLGSAYWQTQNFFTDVATALVLILVVAMNALFPSRTRGLLAQIDEIFVNERTFRNFLGSMQESLKSGLVRVLPVILAAAASGVQLFGAVKVGFVLLVNVNGVYLDPVGPNIWTAASHVLFSAVLFFSALFAFSIIMAFLKIVLAISSIGNDEFRIDITYMDLKVGTYQEIGVFPLSMGLIMIMSATMLGVLGYFYLSVLKSATGYWFMLIMLVVDSVAVFCIFYSTVTIHNQIVEFKEDLTGRLKDYINRALAVGMEKVDFGNLQRMNRFCDEVHKIGDWPLNPASVKKIALSLLSGLLPFMLTIFAG